MQKYFSPCHIFVVLLGLPFFIFPSPSDAADSCKVIVYNFKFCEDKDWRVFTKKEFENGPNYFQIEKFGDTFLAGAFSSTILLEHREEHFSSSFFDSLDEFDRALSAEELVELLHLDPIRISEDGIIGGEEGIIVGEIADLETKTYSYTKANGVFPIVRVSYFLKVTEAVDWHTKVKPIHMVKFASQHLDQQNRSILLTTHFRNPQDLRAIALVAPSIDSEPVKLPMENMIDTHRSIISRLDY